MSTALIAAIAALVTVVCLWLLAALMRRRADRRFEVALAHIDEHMAAIVEHVQRATERVPAGHPHGHVIEPTLDLEALLAQVALEAGARTDAPAAVVHVEGPDGVSARGSFGDPPEREFLHGPLSASSEVYRAVTVDWSQAGSADPGARLYASALVVPLSADPGTSGSIAVYGIGSEAFRQEHVRALESLAVEVSPIVASACRVAAVERRTTTDEATGLRNEKSYRQELDREVARSKRTGRPFAALVVELDEKPEPGVEERDCLWEFAGLVLETTRSTDVVCHPREREFVVLLPETDRDGAETVATRLQADLAARTFRLCSPTVRSTRSVEWSAGETASAFEARARRAEAPPTREPRLSPLGSAAPGSDAPARRALDARDEFIDRLTGEIERARVGSSELSLLLLEPDVRAAGNGGAGAASSRSVLSELAARLDEMLGGATTCSRAGRNQLGVPLLGASHADVEGRFIELRDWLADRLPGVVLAAGVTHLTPTDRAETLFGRAQHALWRARQAGESAVVVADSPDAPAS